MTPEKAHALMDGEPLISLTTAAMSYVKELRDRFLAADIPAALGACEGKT